MVIAFPVYLFVSWLLTKAIKRSGQAELKSPKVVNIYHAICYNWNFDRRLDYTRLQLSRR